MRCDAPIQVETKKLMPDGTNTADVPCGRCPPCKKNRTHAWQFRLLQEDKVSLCSHFVTLTYDTDNVPISPNGFPTLVSTVPAVNKKGKPVRLPHPLSFQAFIKRLRKRCPGQRLKYYCAGEYGDKRKRPHFHAILFNCLDTELIREEWKFGGVHIGDVTGKSVSYTAKYINKEKRIPEFSADDRMKEFSLMSKGLGKNYLSNHVVKYHREDLERNFVTIEDGVKLPLPRYYREKIYDEQMLLDQRKIIMCKISQSEVEEMALYYRENPGGDYFVHKEHQKLSRHKSFYHYSKHIRK